MVAGGDNERKVERINLPTIDDIMGRRTRVYTFPKALDVFAWLRIDNSLVTLSNWSFTSLCLNMGSIRKLWILHNLHVCAFI